MKNFFLCLSFALITLHARSQTKIYQLIDSTENADIDYNKLNQLNSSGSGYSLINKVFKPRKGLFKVYRFICTYKGISHETEKQQVFHDLIILKTDKHNKIIDAYQYTLEWGEMPLTYDLFRLGKKNKELADGLNIKDLAFRRTDNQYNNGQLLNESGILNSKINLLP